MMKKNKGILFLARKRRLSYELVGLMINDELFLLLNFGIGILTHFKNGSITGLKSQASSMSIWAFEFNPWLI